VAGVDAGRFENDGFRRALDRASHSLRALHLRRYDLPRLWDDHQGPTRLSQPVCTVGFPTQPPSPTLCFPGDGVLPVFGSSFLSFLGNPSAKEAVR